MKFSKFIIGSLLVGIFTLSMSGQVYAVGIGVDPILRPDFSPTVTGEKPDLSGTDQVRKIRSADEYRERAVRESLIKTITSTILGIAGLVAIFFIIQNAFNLITAAGAEEQITQSKKGLTWAVVGLLLIILSFSILRFIITLTFIADEAPPAADPAASEAGTTPASAPSPTPPGGSGARQNPVPF